jgi:hypothetical protein
MSTQISSPYWTKVQYLSCSNSHKFPIIVKELGRVLGEDVRRANLPQRRCWSTQKAMLQKLSAEAVEESNLAGEPILAKLIKAPGNHAPLGGSLKEKFSINEY